MLKLWLFLWREDNVIRQIDMSVIFQACIFLYSLQSIITRTVSVSPARMADRRRWSLCLSDTVPRKRTLKADGWIVVHHKENLKYANKETSSIGCLAAIRAKCFLIHNSILPWTIYK